VKKYSFTEEQLLSLIQMALEIGRGEAPKTGPLTVDWPQRLLRHAMQFADGDEIKVPLGFNLVASERIDKDKAFLCYRSHGEPILIRNIGESDEDEY
jgi:hypothetical protein